MVRWYIITVIGARSGHLALSIGKATASPLILIPEEFEHRKPKNFEHHKSSKKRRKLQKFFIKIK